MTVETKHDAKTTAPAEESGVDERDRSPAPGYSDQPEDVSIFDLVVAFIRNTPLILAVALVGLVIGAATPMALGREYVAQSTFSPQQTQDLSRFSGIASQFGVELPGGTRTQSIHFYARLIESPALLAEVVRTEFSFPRTATGADTVSGTLIELYGFDEGTEQQRLYRAMGELSGNVRTELDPSASMVRLFVEASSRPLAVQINRRIIDLIQEFNQQKRRSQYGSERVFVQERLEEVGEELRAARDTIQRFLERNAHYENSPALVMHLETLRQEAARRDQLYGGLQQAYEQARLEEVRNTPLIDEITPPEVAPVSRAGLRPRMGGLIGFMIGAFVGLTIALGREYVGWLSAREPAQMAELRRTSRQVVRGLIPWRKA